MIEIDLTYLPKSGDALVPPKPLALSTPTGLYLDRAPASMQCTGVSNYRDDGRSEKMGVQIVIEGLNLSLYYLSFLQRLKIRPILC